jgi:eukaryotic-like serine/threonine-protein kinase
MPTRVGQYELVRLLAQGGMADIYLARQDGLDRHVAVKLLSGARAADPESRTLFRDEARVLMMLSHGNLASVYEVACEGQMQYLAMEFVHGVDLRVLMQDVERLEAPAAVAIVRAAAAGLDHAHRRCDDEGKPLHLVHRDVSLSNIMITHDGSVKVVDFGIAQTAVSVHTTNPGIVRGKAAYMSPEQALGEPVDLRTDVFALGIVLYELTTGRRCFGGNTDFERMLSIVRGEYLTPIAVVPGYSPGLARIIASCLATDPDQRFASAAALIDALDQLARDERWAQGTAVIAAQMQLVYGEVPAPLGDTAEITAGAIVESRDESQPVMIDSPADAARMAPKRRSLEPGPTVPARRRLAKGTCSEPREDDDAPTRGRRSVPKMFRYAA